MVNIHVLHCQPRSMNQIECDEHVTWVAKEEKDGECEVDVQRYSITYDREPGGWRRLLENNDIIGT